MKLVLRKTRYVCIKGDGVIGADTGRIEIGNRWKMTKKKRKRGRQCTARLRREDVEGIKRKDSKQGS